MSEHVCGVGQGFDLFWSGTFLRAKKASDAAIAAEDVLDVADCFYTDCVLCRWVKLAG